MRSTNVEIGSDMHTICMTDVWNKQDLQRKNTSKFITYLTSILVFSFISSPHMNETGSFLFSFEKGSMSKFTKNVAADLIHFVLLTAYRPKNGLSLRISTSLTILTNGNINNLPDFSPIKLIIVLFYILGFDVLLTWYLL